MTKICVILSIAFLVSCARKPEFVYDGEVPVDGGFYVMDVGEAEWFRSAHTEYIVDHTPTDHEFTGSIRISIDGKEIGIINQLGVSYGLNYYVRDDEQIEVSGETSMPIFVGYRFVKSKSLDIRSDYEWDKVLKVVKLEPEIINYSDNFSVIRNLRKRDTRD